MNEWLKGFFYHPRMAWWIFAFAGFGAMTIALATVSFQSVRAALDNPVNSLKNE